MFEKKREKRRRSIQWSDERETRQAEMKNKQNSNALFAALLFGWTKDRWIEAKYFINEYKRGTNEKKAHRTKYINQKKNIHWNNENQKRTKRWQRKEVKKHTEEMWKNNTRPQWRRRWWRRRRRRRRRQQQTAAMPSMMMKKIERWFWIECAYSLGATYYNFYTHTHSISKVKKKKEKRRGKEKNRGSTPFHARTMSDSNV